MTVELADKDCSPSTEGSALATSVWTTEPSIADTSSQAHKQRKEKKENFGKNEAFQKPLPGEKGYLSLRNLMGDFLSLALALALSLSLSACARWLFVWMREEIDSSKDFPDFRHFPGC